MTCHVYLIYYWTLLLATTFIYKKITVLKYYAYFSHSLVTLSSDEYLSCILSRRTWWYWYNISAKAYLNTIGHLTLSSSSISVYVLRPLLLLRSFQSTETERNISQNNFSTCAKISLCDICSCSILWFFWNCTRGNIKKIFRM